MRRGKEANDGPYITFQEGSRSSSCPGILVIVDHGMQHKQGTRRDIGNKRDSRHHDYCCADIDAYSHINSYTYAYDSSHKA